MRQVNEILIDILDNYEEAREAPFPKHRLFEVIKEELPETLEESLEIGDLEVQGSAGNGNWNKRPFIAFKDLEITDTPQEGVYVDILIYPEENKVRYALDQGYTRVQNEQSASEAREMLKQRKSDVLDQIDLRDFQVYEPDSRAVDEHSIIAFQEFTREELETENRNPVLQELLDVYRSIELGEQKEEQGTRNFAEYIRENPDVSVFRATGPIDHWVTAVEKKVWGFSKESQYDKVSEGDIILFHATKKPKNGDLSSKKSGIIGAGKISNKRKKSEPWWWAEHYEDQEWPYVIDFEPMLMTGEGNAIDRTRSVTEKGVNELEKETYALLQNFMPMEEAGEICQEINGKQFPTMGSMSRLKDQDGKVDREAPARILEELQPYLRPVGSEYESSRRKLHLEDHSSSYGDVDISEELEVELDSEEVLGDLYFPPGYDGEGIVEQAEAALNSGKHIIFTGPPGTGKTEIAEAVSKEVKERSELVEDFELTTATADWSTFDTVGGYMPKKDGGENLEFQPGQILRRFKKNGEQRNEMLVIDEINRADIDKAFGQMFTVLSGQNVQLPFTDDNDEEIQIRHGKKTGNRPPENGEYIVPNSWRMIATMNSYDKTSLYEMSYAFMRRFTFIRVDVPEVKTSAEFVRPYAEAWSVELEDEQLETVAEIWKATNEGGRKIGPALVKDMMKYMEKTEDGAAEAVISYVYPQLEGVRGKKDVINGIKDVDDLADHQDRLVKVAEDMFQIEMSDS